LVVAPAGDVTAEREAAEGEFADPDAGAAAVESLEPDFLVGVVTVSDAGRELIVPVADFDAGGGFVGPEVEEELEEVDGVFAAAEFSGLEEATLELADFAVEGFVERKKYRGMKRIARRIAAAAPTSTSVFELEDLGGVETRRGPAMVAFTWGSEETGMRVRAGGVAAFGEIGESGTASGSICGSGCRCTALDEPVAAAAWLFAA